MNLEQPYGDGNHRRMKWRQAWDVDREALTATHRDTGFKMAFQSSLHGGFVAKLASEFPELGPDDRTCAAQIHGLSQLLLDGWEIFHIAIKRQHDK